MAKKRNLLMAMFLGGLMHEPKFFIEYVPAEYAWLPVTAPNYLMINCFWVSGQYKGQGHGYNLLQFCD